MGTVIAFQARTGDDVPSRRAKDQGEAEVVIFPGVRVEYHTVDLSHRVMALPSHDADPIRR